MQTNTYCVRLQLRYLLWLSTSKVINPNDVISAACRKEHPTWNIIKNHLALHKLHHHNTALMCIQTSRNPSLTNALSSFSCRRNLANIRNNHNMVLINKKLKQLKQIQTVQYQRNVEEKNRSCVCISIWLNASRVFLFFSNVYLKSSCSAEHSLLKSLCYLSDNRIFIALLCRKTFKPKRSAVTL